MAPRAMSIGSMVSFAVDRSARTGGEPGGGERLGRREAFARGLLEYVLKNAKGRSAFTRLIAGLDDDPQEFRTAPRTGPVPFDLVSPLSDGGQIAITVRVEGTVDDALLTQLLAELPASSCSRLVVLTPRSGRVRTQIADERLVLLSWNKLARRLTAKDPKRAEFWRLLGEFGEDAGPLAVRSPASPRILLDEAVTQEMRAHLETFRLVSQELIGRDARFSTSRRGGGAVLQVGASGSQLGVEFGPVEDGTPVWLTGSRPVRSFALGIGALATDEERDLAQRRLRGIAAGSSWRTDPAYEPTLGEFIGTPASPALEDARALLWEVFDPRRLEAAGFPTVPRRQPELGDDRLSVRVSYPPDPAAGTFLVSIGGSSTWKTLLPRVTREYDGKTYIVQAPKSDTAQDLVTKVHEALVSLATKP